MSGNLDDFARVSSPVPKVEHPKDWHPHVTTAGDSGSAIVTTAEDLSSQDDLEVRLIVEAGANPEVWVPINISHRKWQDTEDAWLNYWKFDFVKRAHLPSEERLADIEELKKLFDVAPVGPRDVPTGDDAFVIVASDWQIGKGEGGGTEATIERWKYCVEAAKKQVADLRKVGYGVPQLAIFGTGDLHEQVCGFYSGQLFQIDLNKRDQSKVVRRMLSYGVRELAPLFDDVLLTAVGGNHGQASRPQGKQLTDNADNDDVAVFEVVEEIVEGRDGYDHVRFQLPNQDLDITVDVAGVPIGLAHGNQFTGGGKLSQGKALEWWKNQSFGLQNTSDARILVSSHFHHYSCVVHGVRTHFQSPALDGGSRWFRDSSGQDAPAGVLTFRVDASTTLGWDHARVLSS